MSQWVKSGGFCRGRGAGRLCSLPRHRTRAPCQRHASALARCMWKAQDTGKESAEALHPCNLGRSPWTAAWSLAQRPRHQQERVRTQPLQQLLPSRRYHTWKKCLGLHPGCARNTSLPGPSAAVGDRVRRLGLHLGVLGAVTHSPGLSTKQIALKALCSRKNQPSFVEAPRLDIKADPAPPSLALTASDQSHQRLRSPVRSWYPSPSASSRLFF